MEVNLNALKSALAPVALATKHRVSSVPILGNVRLRQDGSMLQLTGTDCEVFSEQAIEAKFDKDWQDTTVNADGLSRYVRSLSGEKVSLAVSKAGRLSVTGSGAKAQFATIGIDSFPDVPEFEAKASCEMDFTVLARMIRQAKWAVAQQDDHKNFTLDTMQLKVDTRAVMYATDGRCVARSIGEALNISGEFSILMSPTTIGLIEKTFVNGEIVALRIGDSLFSIASGASRIVARMVRGSFPNAERFFQEEAARPYSLEPKAVIGAVSQAAQFSVVDTKILTPSMMAQVIDGRLVLACQNKDAEFGSADIECAGADSEFVTIGPAYLSGAADACGGPFEMGIKSDSIDISGNGVRCVIAGKKASGGEEKFLRGLVGQELVGA